MTTTEPAQTAQPDTDTLEPNAATGLDTPPTGGLSDTEARAAARDAWRANPELTGAEIAAQFGRSERWGRQQIAAARATTDGTTGTPQRQPQDRAGTAGPARRQAASGNTGKAPARAGAPGPRHGRAGSRQAPARTAVPLSLVAVTVAAVVLVAGVCAVVSYSHIRDLAAHAGMGSLASWLPLGVDGLVVASSCSLIVDRRLGRPGQALAWIGVALGLAGSLAANVLAVDPTLVSLRAVRWVLAGYSPAALAVSGHLLFQMLGELRQPAPRTGNTR